MPHDGFPTSNRDRALTDHELQSIRFLSVRLPIRDAERMALCFLVDQPLCLGFLQTSSQPPMGNGALTAEFLSSDAFQSRSVIEQLPAAN